MYNIDESIISFGKRLQEARLLRNITQDYLAEKCGVTPKHVSAVERGTTPGSITLLLNICNCLEISPNSLFIDSLQHCNKETDNIIPIQKHDIILKYSKLTDKNKDFIDSAINHMFEEQSRKS